MALVLSRKDGEKITIHTAGGMKIGSLSVKQRKTRTEIVFDFLPEFKITRDEIPLDLTKKIPTTKPKSAKGATSCHETSLAQSEALTATTVFGLAQISESKVKT